MISADTAIKTMIIVLLAARSVLLTLVGYVAQKLNDVLKIDTIWLRLSITVTLIFAVARPLEPLLLFWSVLHKRGYV